MKRWRIVAAAATTAALVTALGAGTPVGAQEEEPDLLPITVEPTTLTVGESFTVSGADCLNEDSTPGDVQVDVFNEHREEPQSFPAEVNEDGTWSLELQSEQSDVGLNGVTATCFVSPESDEIVAEYDLVLVTINAIQTTPTTAQPPATPPPAPPSAPPIAAPATPQQGEPNFTG